MIINLSDREMEAVGCMAYLHGVVESPEFPRFIELPDEQKKDYQNIGYAVISEMLAVYIAKGSEQLEAERASQDAFGRRA